VADWDAVARGAVNIEVEAHLRQALASGRTLRVKLGIDPSSPDIHLGHTVVLGKLGDFQRLGHQAVLIIGDFTARIGDPSGQSATRRPLEVDEVEANAATYLEQVFKVLDPARTEVRRQSEWFGGMTLAEVLRLAGRVTLAQIATRDDFRKRIEAGTPVGLHELMYPLMQAYDSVAVKSDVELGGTDQLFNLMFGRDLQREHGQEPQDVITMPLLEGLDGVNKMSKSLGNYVGVSEDPFEMYGKLMSVPDELIIRYMQLASALPVEDISEFERSMSTGSNPRDAKSVLAHSVVSRFHGAQLAEAARERWELQFQARQVPADMPEVSTGVFVGALNAAAVVRDLLGHAGLGPVSLSEARRLIVQGGVRLNGVVINDPGYEYQAEDGHVWQVGKRRFVRLRSTMSAGGEKGSQ